MPKTKGYDERRIYKEALREAISILVLNDVWDSYASCRIALLKRAKKKIDKSNC